MQFQYQAKNQTGQAIQGTIDAPSDEQAVAILPQKNLFILSLYRASSSTWKMDLNSLFSRPSKKDLVVFTRQLATLIESGIPLIEGLQVLAHQMEKPSFRKVVNAIITSIEGGASLSIALQEHDNVFDAFFVNLVRVGEVSGKLQTTLNYLADYLEHSASLNSKIKGALFYPAFVLSSLVVVGAIMMTTVVPQLLQIIQDAGVTDLPLMTRILLAVSAFLHDYIIVVVVVVVALIIGIYEFTRTATGRYQWDSFKIHVPRFGRISRNLYIARIAETLATLIRSGVPILEGLSITARVVGNEVYERILLGAVESLRGGGSISEALAQHEEFPSLVSSMIATGEKTGRTDFMLENILKYYKTEAENDVQNLSQLIEPFLILILGIGIGGLVAAVLLPIYSLVSVQ